MKIKKNNISQIISYLRSNEYATAKKLAAYLNVSERTIHNYISIINSKEKIIDSSIKGYSLCNESSLKHDEQPMTQNERIFYIITQLFKHGNTISCMDLCNNLYISDATLQKDIHILKEELAQCNVTLKKKTGYLHIIGEENDKRNFIRKMIIKNNDSSEFGSSINSFYYNESSDFYSEIKDITLDCLKECNLYINDYSLSNLILHLCITTNRLLNNSPIRSSNFTDFSSFPEELKAAQLISSKLASKYSIEFCDDEIYQIAFLLLSKTSNINFYSLDKMNVASLIGTTYYKMADEMIKKVYDYFYLDISDEEFLLKFSLHLKNVIFRASNNYSEKNQIFDTIKFKYPLVYDIAVFCAMEFKKMTGYSLNEDEISFLGIHIGSVIEQKNKLATKIKCILVYPKYYDYYRAVLVKLNSHFGNDIEVVSIVSVEETIPDIDYDLIISTVNIQENDKSIVIINPFLTDEDFEKIDRKISKIKENKANDSYKLIYNLFNDDLFENEVYLSGPNEYIEYMAEKAIQKEYIPDNFKKAVLERENNASTSFDNLLAIPHTIEVSANKSFCFVIINKTPVKWGNFDVNVIILIGIDKNSDVDFKDMYLHLLNLFDNPDNMQKIIGCSSYEKFMRVIKELNFQ